MVERKDPQLGRGVVLGDGHDIQASRILNSIST
jgi:hypothetical protein